jgi:hypothetical protein
MKHESTDPNAEYTAVRRIAHDDCKANGIAVLTTERDLGTKNTDFMSNSSAVKLLGSRQCLKCSVSMGRATASHSTVLAVILGQRLTGSAWKEVWGYSGQSPIRKSEAAWNGAAENLDAIECCHQFTQASASQHKWERNSI